jgi:hypothetical protein
LVDSARIFAEHASGAGGVDHLLSWINHPNSAGHGVIADELLRWFPITCLPTEAVKGHV